MKRIFLICILLLVGTLMFNVTRTKAAKNSVKYEDVYYNFDDITEMVISENTKDLWIPNFRDFSNYDAEFKQRNGFLHLPNLKRFIVSPENKDYMSSDGILYSKYNNIPDSLLCVPRAYRGKVRIGKSVTYIEDNAFDNCNGISEFVVEEGNPSFYSKGGILFEKKEGDKYDLTNDGDVLYAVPPELDISTYKIANNVSAIEACAFANNQFIEEIEIPNQITYIPVAAFANCKKLKKVTLHKGIKTIGNSAFSGCCKLKKIHFPEGLEVIYPYSFKGTAAMKKITLPTTCFDARATGLKVARNGCVTVKCPELNVDIKAVEEDQENDIEGQQYVNGLFRHEGKYVYKGYSASALYKRIKKFKYTTCKPLKDDRFKSSVKMIKKGVKGTGKPDTSWYTSKTRTFYIKNPDQLAGLLKLVYKGETNFHADTIVLKKNLDMSCYKNFQTCFSDPNYSAFYGTFNGNGKTIYNLTMHAYGKNGVGLFGVNAGVIKNLTLCAANVFGGEYVGGVTGLNKGKVIKCKVSGTVKGFRYVHKVGGALSYND